MTNTTVTVLALAADWRNAARADSIKADEAAAQADGYRTAAENIVAAWERRGFDAARLEARRFVEVVEFSEDRMYAARQRGWVAAGQAALDTFLAEAPDPEEHCDCGEC